MSTMRSTRPKQPFNIYEDYTFEHPFHQNTIAYEHERKMSTSPSPYDADHASSDGNEDSVLPSIEDDKGRRSSAAFTSVSSIPPSLPYNSGISPYAPRKGNRPAFRSPSSVRAMQMSSPPPFQRVQEGHMRMGSPMSARRRGGTPSSVRSGSVLHNHNTRLHEFDRESMTSNGSARGTPSVQHRESAVRGSLVLLHITVLPSPGLPYSIESLQEHAPSYVLQNWYMLQEKLTETVLSRGVLIPHPGEEFDLLEESLLETLGLVAPRISSCGHFHGSHDIESGSDSGVSGVGDSKNQLISLSAGHQRWSSHSDMEDTCQDCEQPIRIPGKGIGAGNTRWDLKVYASNGLLSAGAWFAACKEMERVDVEIEPWIPEDVKRALDAAAEKEAEQIRKEHEELEKLKFDLEVMEQLRVEGDEARAAAEQHAAELAAELEQAKASMPPPHLGLPALTAPPQFETELVVPRKREPSDVPQQAAPVSFPQPPSMPHAAPEIPLSTLLQNYLILLAQDRRNMLVGALSVLVIFLSLRLGSSPKATTIGPGNTTIPAYGSNILSAMPAFESEGFHSMENAMASAQSFFSTPVNAIVSTMGTPVHSILAIPSTPAEEIMIEDSPIASTNALPSTEEGAANVSHSSVLLDTPDDAINATGPSAPLLEAPLTSN